MGALDNRRGEMNLHDYEEYFGYMPEADAIIEEAKTKLIDLLSSEVKTKLQESIKQAEMLDELKRKCGEAEARLSRINRKIEEAEKQLEKSELYDMPKKYVARFVKNAIGDFTVGDNVYTFGYVREYEDCPVCKGVGEFDTIVSDEKIKMKCSYCNGVGKRYVDKRTIERARISTIHLKLCFHEDRTSFWSSDNIYLDRKQYATPLKNIFATKEEAEKALAELEENNGEEVQINR